MHPQPKIRPKYAPENPQSNLAWPGRDKQNGLLRAHIKGFKPFICIKNQVEFSASRPVLPETSSRYPSLLDGTLQHWLGFRVHRATR